MASNRVSAMRLSMVSLYAGGCPGVAARVCAQPPQHPPVVPQRVIPLRRLDNLNVPGESRVPHDPAERLRADLSLADPLVPIDPRSAPGAGAGAVTAPKPMRSNHPAKFLTHSVKPPDIDA